MSGERSYFPIVLLPQCERSYRPFEMGTIGQIVNMLELTWNVRMKTGKSTGNNES